jgi:superoxide dismutase, Fe-Mn family
VAFKVKTNIKPIDLDGLSDEQIEQHFSLYEKYVEQLNKLIQLEHNLTSADQNFATITLRNDLIKQIAFERNGVFLHEAYFTNLKAGSKPSKNGAFTKLIKHSFKSVDNFLDDFKNVCKARGEIWALASFDLDSKQLFNHIIESHEHYLQFRTLPILVCDIWTHAYAVDLKITAKDEYIDIFLKNINWQELDKRAAKLV